jgi:formate dehydrogenase subunit gamma
MTRIIRYSFSERLMHALSAVSYVYLLLTGLAFCWMLVTWRSDMRVTSDDRAWRKAMRHYLRNEDALVPAAGRFNFGQKQFFWLMVVSAFALLVSGIVLWFIAAVPRELMVLRYVAILVHAAAALATIGGIIIHIYMGIAVVPEGLHAIVHGDVSERWARHHHGLWAPRAPRNGHRHDQPVDLGR